MKNARFYISKVAFCQHKDSKLDFIPMLLRRKLSNLDKLSFSSIREVYDENFDEFVFSSQYGEWERLFSIIEQYKTANEVSPIAFSASVHNYIAGILSLVKNSNSPYYAISAGENSFSSGLIKSVISKKKVLYCYADNFEKEQCISLIISSQYEEGSICVDFVKDVSSLHSEEQHKEFEEFEHFIKGKNNVFKTKVGEFHLTDD